MKAFLDANVLIRYLLGSATEKSERARRLIDGDTSLEVTEVVLVETAYVLTKQYGRPRSAVVDALVDFLQKENIRVRQLPTDAVIAGLLWCRNGGHVNFADAFLWAAACTDGPATVYSFDGRFPSEEVNLQEPE